MIKLIITASISSFFFGLFGVSWESVDRNIDSEFPATEFISTDALVQQYRQSRSDIPAVQAGIPTIDAGTLVIIDVREPEEFQVSHLENALNLETAVSISQLITDKRARIVVYCSVGYRSARVAASLKELGYTQVQNLHHSIFEWASKGYPLVNQSGETDKVHPFNRAWGSLVEDSLHSYSVE